MEVLEFAIQLKNFEMVEVSFNLHLGSLGFNARLNALY